MGTRFLAAAAVLFLGSVVGFLAVAQPNPNQLISNRKGAMNLQAKYYGPILAMAQGRAPYDAKIVQRNADYLAALSQMPWDDYQPHSIGLDNTRAKTEINSNQAKFRQMAEQLQAETQKLQAAARGGDENGVKSLATSVGRACNGCHEDFASFNFRFKL